MPAFAGRRVPASVHACYPSRALRRTLCGCYNRRSMRTSKQKPALLLALLLSVGTACAQVCDVGCVLFGDLTAASSSAGQPASTSSHCHEPASRPSSEEPSPGQTSGDEPSLPGPHQNEHSSDCQSHGYSVTTVKLGYAALADMLEDAPSDAIALFWMAGALNGSQSDACAQAKSYRSPPARAIFSTLRI